MGTSSKWRGPAGQPWIGVSGNVARQLDLVSARTADKIPLPRPDDTEVCLGRDVIADRGTRFRVALAAALRKDPAAFDLYATMHDHGRLLVRIAGSLVTTGFDALDPPPPEWSAGDEDWFVYQFARGVAGDGNTLVDAMARRAVVRCAERILREQKSSRADDRLSTELFCLVYRLFFAEMVAEFVRAVVAENIKLAVPGLVLIDPAGHIADWVAGQVVDAIPNPCETGHARGADGLIIDLAADLVKDAVERALGIDGARW